MEIPEQTKTFLIIIIALIVITYLVYDARPNKFSCDKWANDVRLANFSLILS